jgi:integrase/recombinase XerD
VASGTLYFYKTKLALFERFCEGRAVTQITQIDANFIRQYLLYLEGEGHNPGGVHACYRTVKTFLLWWEQETEPEDWKNPIRKVKAPKLAIEPLEPVDFDTIRKMIETCKKNAFTGVRDRAIMLFLLDSGVRAAEFCAADLTECNFVTGEVLIRQGKGRKPRVVYLGQKTRRAVRAYMKMRADNNPALWVTDEGERLTYWGLRSMMTRRAKMAGVECPELHAFRRAFALNFLRNNPGDIYSLQELMGHADLQVLKRYLKQTNQDTREAHRRGSPVDNGNF